MLKGRKAIVTGSTSGIGLGDAGAMRKQPSARFTSVAQLGALTVFLATEAAASITGTALPVDGGWLAR